MMCLPCQMWEDMDKEIVNLKSTITKQSTPTGVSQKKSSEVQIIHGTVAESDRLTKMVNTWLSAGFVVRDIHYVERGNSLDTRIIFILIRSD